MLTARLVSSLVLVAGLAALSTGCGDEVTADPSTDPSPDATGPLTDVGDDPHGAETGDNDTSADGAPTWNETVGPLLAANCGACHLPGGSGQFSLLDYDTARTFAPTAVLAMQDRRMPPWPASPDCREYEDERHVSADQIATVEAWIAAGYPTGAGEAQSFESPALPTLRVDLAAAMEEPYTPSASATDDYRCFVMDATFDTDTWIEGTQVLPGSTQVHHVLVYALDEVAAAEALAADADEEGPGYTCFGGPAPSSRRGGGPQTSVPTQIGAWVPGILPAILPTDTALRIAPGQRIVMQVHYNTLNGAPLPDQTVFQMQLRDSDPSFLWRTLPIVQRNLRIEPNDPASTHSVTITNYNNTPTVIGSIAGHMHTLGTSLNVTIQRQDGGEECLVDIPRWDFDWQLFYQLPADSHAVIAPGDSVTLTCTYDNTARNQQVVDGERITPRLVTWGEGTLDEMCLAYIGVITPWVPPPAPGTGTCGAVAGCYAACDPKSMACLLDCDGQSADCLTCTLQGLVPCATGCAPSFLAARTCLTECVLANVSLGSAVSACMQAECGDQYTAMTACLDPVLQAGTCDVPLSACGLE